MSSSAVASSLATPRVASLRVARSRAPSRAPLRARVAARASNDASDPSEATVSSVSSDASAASSPSPPPYAGPPRVVVIGGGFGGLYTALKLDALDGWKDGLRPRVTLVDRAERFVFKPLLYELVNETMKEWEVCPTFEDLLAPTDIAFHRGDVASVRPDAGDDAGGVVRLADGTHLAYDYLVVGAGTVSSVESVPGAKDHAVPLSTLEDAQRLAGALRDAETKRLRSDSNPATYEPSFAVVGGGLSGVELAGVVAERMRAAEGNSRVELLASSAGIMPESPAGQREAAMRRLESCGVTIRVGARATRVGAATTPDPLAPARAALAWTEAGEERLDEFDVVCWTVGQKVESPETWPFPRSDGGKILTDATLRVVGQSRVFAVGDAAERRDPSSSSDEYLAGGDVASSSYAAPPPGAPLPSTAQVAFQQADYAAWNVWSSAAGRPLLPFRYQHIGDMMVLGKTDAAVALPLGDATVDGPIAALLRRAAYLYRMPTDAHRAKLAGSWLEQSAKFAAEEGPDILRKLGVPLPPEIERLVNDVTGVSKRRP